MGRWFQTYASKNVKETFEGGGNCVTADYGAVEGRSDVITARNTFKALGLPVSIGGYAVANPDQNGEFQVTLGPFANPKSPKELFRAVCPGNLQAWPVGHGRKRNQSFPGLRQGPIWVPFLV